MKYLEKVSFFGIIGKKFLILTSIFENSRKAQIIMSIIWPLLAKRGFCSSVWSTKTFLYNIRDPKYKQNNMGYQISRI